MFFSSQNSKCQDLPKFQFFGRGVCSVVVKTRSAKEGGWWGVLCSSQNSKCQDFNGGGVL